MTNPLIPIQFHNAQKMSQPAVTLLLDCGGSTSFQQLLRTKFEKQTKGAARFHRARIDLLHRIRQLTTHEQLVISDAFIPIEFIQDKDIVIQRLSVNEGRTVEEYKKRQPKQGYSVYLKVKAIMIEHAMKLFENDEDAQKIIVRNYPEAIKYAAEHLKKDVPLILESLRYGMWEQDAETVMQQVADSVFQNRDFLLGIANHTSCYLDDRFPKEIWQDREFALKLFAKRNAYFPERFFKDMSFVLDAIKRNCETRDCRTFVQPRLLKKEQVLGEKAIFLKIIKLAPMSVYWKYLPKEVLHDEDILLQLIEYQDIPLTILEKSTDKSFMIKAIKRNALAQYFVCDNLKKDEDVLRSIQEQPNTQFNIWIENEWKHYIMPLEELKKDRAKLVELICNNMVLMRLASDVLKQDTEALKEISRNLFQNDGTNMKFLNVFPQELMENKEFVSHVGKMIQVYFSDDFVESDDFDMEEIRDNVALLAQVEPTQSTCEFISKAMKFNFRAEFFEFQIVNDREFLLAEARHYPRSLLDHVSDDIRNDVEFLKKLVKIHNNYLDKCCLHTDKQFMLDLVESDAYAGYQIPTELLELDFCKEMIKRNFEAYTNIRYYNTELEEDDVVLEILKESPLVNMFLLDNEEEYEFMLEPARQVGLILHINEHYERLKKERFKYAYMDCYIPNIN